jgi:hypothetical protein
VWFAAKQPRPSGIAVVIAAASEGVDVSDVVDGLSQTARVQEMSVAVGQILWREGEPHVVLTESTASSADADRPVTEVRRLSPPLACMRATNEVDPESSAWLSEILGHVDLLYVVGPPLDRSPGSAHVATLCDGLVIVIEGDTTSKDDLCAAAARARAIGCRLLGVVVQVKRRRIGRWTRPFSLWKRGR